MNEHCILSTAFFCVLTTTFAQLAYKIDFKSQRLDGFSPRVALIFDVIIAKHFCSEFSFIYSV